jgi:hypothetical protein
MSKELRILALTAAALLAARVVVLAIDTAVNGWRRHQLYQD